MRPPASTGPSRRRSPCRRTTAGAAPMKAIRETRRSSRRYAGRMVEGLQGRPARRIPRGRPRHRHRQAFPRRRRHAAATTRATRRSRRPSCATSTAPATCRRSRPACGTIMASFSSWQRREDDRQQEPAHRRAQGPHGLRRLRRRRLERARPGRPAAPTTAARTRSTPGSTCSWRRTAGSDSTTTRWRR